jgi:fructokinase
MILVIGEALIDLIENRYQAGAFNAVVGGANANVALALARRGTKHQFLGRISNDRFGKIIRDRLESNGVNLEHSIDATELTTLAVVSIDSHGVPNYSFYVNGTADWGWTPAELPSDVDLENMHATAIQFGCLTMAMAPGNAVIEEWAKAHYDQKSVTISHDINMRPALGFEREVERERVERVNSFSHVIKASDEDIQWLYGLDEGAEVDDIVKARRHWPPRIRHPRWRRDLDLPPGWRAHRCAITQDQCGRHRWRRRHFLCKHARSAFRHGCAGHGCLRPPNQLERRGLA